MCTDPRDNATNDHNDAYSGDNELPCGKVGRWTCVSLFIY